MNKRGRKKLRRDDFNAQPWRKQVLALLQDKRIKLSIKERDFLTKCYGYKQLGARQKQLLLSIEKSRSLEPTKKRKYPGYNIPGYDIPIRQRNILEELKRPDLQSV